MLSSQRNLLEGVKNKGKVKETDFCLSIVLFQFKCKIKIKKLLKTKLTEVEDNKK